MSSQAVIIDRSAAGESGDYAVALTTTDASRTISIGTNWSRIRIGVRWAVSSSAVQNTTIASPHWCIGLCSGTGSTYTTNNAHYIGTDMTAGSNFLINHAGTSTGFYVTSGDGANVGITRRLITKIGSTITTWGSAYIDNLGAYITSGSPDRTPQYIDFSKQITSSGSVVDPGLWQVTYYTPNSPTTDTTATPFYTQLSADTASGGIVTRAAIRDIPISESINGYMTTVNIFWAPGDPALEVSDVAVWRFA